MERTENLTRASAPVGLTSGSYIDWSAILAGAVVATAVAALFTAFGAALGLSALSAEPGEGSFSIALLLTAVWLVITLVVSYLMGGYIAGRMRRRVDDATADEVSMRDGINGIVVWGVGMLVGAMLLANAASSTISAAGAVAGTAATVAGAAVGGLAQGAIGAAGAALPDAATTNPMGFVTDTLMRPSPTAPASSEPGSALRETSGILANVLQTGEISDSDRAYLAATVAGQTGLAPAEAAARVDTAVTAAQDARAEAERIVAEAKDTAIKVAETARVTAILSGFLLAAASLVAAAAATIGAVRGGLHRDQGRVFGGLSYRV